ncbi:MAG: hypothetical protein HY719_13680 [Planctomycetes bacterium]|nr:hypothetical protein [Planctomycetota bacterium]
MFHVLAAVDVEGDNVRVVTAYRPDAAEWRDDLNRVIVWPCIANRTPATYGAASRRYRAFSATAPDPRNSSVGR